ncbi:hypothetical protein N5I87_12165 [Ralstonia sp. CHL-2022]|uniref:Uncharacterized protein n=1 Tax=Ralstonia mojiangensis TaxID=2953895 RepID=A0AAE3LBB0_9RALS|nr:hypothetical protein [Ralstonia mojiangensis]MCT7316760.1 hypothetical protein [Ralstonia mojiangensis]
MPSHQEVIAAAGGAAFIIVALIGGVGFIFRQALAAWLTRRLGQGLERKAERYKHDLAREMEKYKDELNRAQNVDRFRAEARKAVAERLLDRRLEALHEVSLFLHDVPSWIIAGASVPLAGRGSVETMLAKLRELSGAFDKHSLYFEDQFRSEYRRLCTNLHRLAGNWMHEAVLSPDDPQIAPILHQTASLQRLIDQMHKRLPDELANSIANEGTQRNTGAIPAQDTLG